VRYEAVFRCSYFSQSVLIFYRYIYLCLACAYFNTHVAKQRAGISRPPALRSLSAAGSVAAQDAASRRRGNKKICSTFAEPINSADASLAVLTARNETERKKRIEMNTVVTIEL
jgi:hypothetical protein